MSDFLLVVGIAVVAAFLTYLGAPVAERFDVPHRVVSAALQFAGGVITAIVVLSLMPPAVRGGPALLVALAFFIGGALFVLFEYFSARKAAARPAGPGADLAASLGTTSLGLYVGVLLDMLIDGVVIGIGSALTVGTGLLLALGIAVSTAPLAFVSIATAKRQGMAHNDRQWLSYLFFLSLLVGALVGYIVLRNQPVAVKLVLIAMASGFLITTVTQSLVPEALREGVPGLGGIFFIAGLTLFALLGLVMR
jgi:zinc transporter, ZIP family